MGSADLGGDEVRMRRTQTHEDEEDADGSMEKEESQEVGLH